MPKPSKSIWYHLGYALESARHGVRSARRVESAGKVQTGGKVRSGGKTRPGGKGQAAKNGGATVRGRSARSGPVSSTVDQLITTGTSILGDSLFSILAGRRPGGLRMTRAALAGAGAALALSLFRNGTNGKSEGGLHPLDPAAEILAGAARGMLYGAVLEPRLPGSPLLRGATFGIMEYVTSPFGGLDGILGASSPHRTLPILAALLGTGDLDAGSESVSMAHHIAFGVTLGLLYGEGSARRGRRAAE